MANDTMCPDPDRVAQLMSGELPDAEVDAICDHVVTYTACTTILRTVSDNSALPHVASSNPGAWSADIEDSHVIEQLIAGLKIMKFQTRLHPGRLLESESQDKNRFTLNENATEIEASINLKELSQQLLRPPKSSMELGWLGTYRVLSVLGCGGMGVVFAAEDPLLGRRVAIKAMQPSLLRREEHRLRFLREARTAASLDHDNIIPIHHVGEDGDVPFFVMPLLKGESLESWQRRGERISITNTLRIARQIATGIAAAHACGLIHRDIKPGNIWLEDRGQQLPRVRILDFGLARPESDDSNLTQTGTIAGTPAFMAPEQARGESADALSDIFSLGCVLYFLFAGKPPFAGRNSAAMMFAVIHHQPDSLRDIDPQIPEKLASLVSRLLEKNPTLRLPSATNVAEALDEIENELSHDELRKASSEEDTVSAQSSSPLAVIAHQNQNPPSDQSDLISPAGSRLRIRHWAMIGTFAAALLIAVGMLFVVRQVFKVQTSHGTIILTFDSQAADGAQVSVDEQQRISLKLHPGDDPITLEVDPGTHKLKVAKAGFRVFAHEFTISAGGQKTIHVQLEPQNESKSPADIAESSKIGQQNDRPPRPAAEFIRDADVPLSGLVPRPRPVAGLRGWQMETRAPRGDIFAIAWDSDGRRIACGSPTGNVRIIDRVTSTTLNIIPAHTGSVWAMDWSPTEDLVVSVGEDGKVRLFDPQGIRRWELGSHEGTARSVAFSRDGSWIASGGADTKIRLWRSTGEPGPILSGHTSQVDGIAWHPSGRKLASASLDGTVRIWNLDGTWNSNGIRGPELKGHLGGVLGLSWSADGELLASGGVDGTILLWTSQGTKHSVISGQVSTITAISWGKNGLIATSDEDKTVRFWQRDGSLIRTQKLDARRINDVEWSRDGSQLAVATDCLGVRILNSSGDWEGGIPLNTTSMRAISFNQSGELATAGDEGFVAVWNRDGTLKQQLNGHTKSVSSISWSPDASRLVSGSWESSIRIWNVQKNTAETRTGTTPTAWNPASEEIAWTSGESVLLAESETTQRLLSGHKSQVVQLVWNSNGTQIASSDVSGEIRLWNRDGSAAGIIQTDPMTLAIGWNPKRPILASGCTGHGNIQLWNPDGQPMKTWNAHTKGVIVLDWSPDGTQLLSSSYDQRMHIWNMDGKCAGTLTEPTAIGCAGVWDSTGQQIATAHIDGTTRRWDGTTFQPISTNVIFNDGNWAQFDSTGLSHVSDPNEVNRRLVVVTERESGEIEMMNVSELRKRTESAEQK